MRIFLIGFMGAGKTTIGKKLASELNFKFIDLDQFIEQKHKASIPFIFNLIGEEGFRLIESRTLQEVLKNDNYILSTGGGTPCFYDNMKLMNDHGLTIYLKMPANILLQRLKYSKKKRPLIESLSENELLNFISEKLKDREKFYNRAKITLNATDIEAKELKKIIQNFTQN